MLPERKLLILTEVQKHCGIWATETFEGVSTVSVSPHAKSVTSVNYFPRELLFKQNEHFSLPSLYLIFYGKLFFASLVSTCKTKCIFWALGHLSWSARFWHGELVSKLQTSMGPNMNHHAGDFHIHVKKSVITAATYCSCWQGKVAKLAGRYDWKRFTDTVLSSDTCCHGHPRQREPTQATHASSAFGPKVHIPVSSWSQPHLAVGGVQTGPAVINFTVNFTSISPDVFLEEENPLARIHLYSSTTSVSTYLQLYGFAIWRTWLLFLPS